MGKLHKIRHEYNKFSTEEKKTLVEVSRASYWATPPEKKVFVDFLRKFKQYRYYIQHLLKKENFISLKRNQFRSARYKLIPGSDRIKKKPTS